MKDKRNVSEMMESLNEIIENFTKELEEVTGYSIEDMAKMTPKEIEKISDKINDFLSSDKDDCETCPHKEECDECEEDEQYEDGDFIVSFENTGNQLAVTCQGKAPIGYIIKMTVRGLAQIIKKTMKKGHENNIIEDITNQLKKELGGK